MSHGTYDVISYEGHVTIIWRGDSLRERGTASADQMGEDWWWVCRVLVDPKDVRGQGIGTELITRLKAEVVKGGCRRLVVSPGGYDMDQSKQRQFYIRNGFSAEDAEHDRVYVWRP
ncbi:MAG: GNAT family N-acetyltransferase [Candidatus Altiarchaeales archaeon]|nr:GNAT family N-acetyltransferase [Candidatus Altiarchaeales archaeon]